MMSTQDILTIIGVNIALFGALATMVYWLVTRIDSDVKNIRDDIKSISSRMDSHAQRIDQLYRMFVDLLKEGKK